MARKPTPQLYVRSGVLRQAEWSEINLHEAMWQIRAARIMHIAQRDQEILAVGMRGERGVDLRRVEGRTIGEQLRPAGVYRHPQVGRRAPA